MTGTAGFGLGRGGADERAALPSAEMAPATAPPRGVAPVHYDVRTVPAELLCQFLK